MNSSARVATYFDDLQVNQEPPLIVQENHYDAWGLNLAGIEKQGSPNDKFQYNGKEKQEEFGLNGSDYEARIYDAQLGRWHAVDPLSADMAQWSPYNFTFNNPILLVDILGLSPVYNWETGEYEETNKKGKKRKVSWDEAKSNLEKSSKDPVNIILMSNNTKDHNNVAFIQAADAKDVVDKIESFLGNDRIIGNLFIGSHGGYKKASFSIGSMRWS
ncbi:RHS repeat-associated core domain-containing protein [Cytophagaceae bacterium YF14B1]|uniref:RHS repeat-associated core domain-containing protein n=1 Tax=Xanthocytophaga flava TaxID=3048013 RepID=A0AAE3UE23_9BACT|nr:RHS repeat-associated core domain-containing protein [Xanthocytophaga flavus]MDJ1486364.1 RHS repeat-associated core domain-containing protein [Xanthocytophaga flavus]